MEDADLLVSQTIRVDCQLMEAGREGLIFTKIARGDVAFGASSTESAGHECLLRIITYEICKNWVAPVPHTITTFHSNS